MMQNKGQVTIHIEGKYGAEKLTPEDYDITLMQSVLEYVIALLDLDKRKETPTTTFHIENGSVNNVFTTSKQKAVEFASVLALITSTASIKLQSLLRECRGLPYKTTSILMFLLRSPKSMSYVLHLKPTLKGQRVFGQMQRCTIMALLLMLVERINQISILTQRMGLS